MQLKLPNSKLKKTIAIVKSQQNEDPEARRKLQEIQAKKNQALHEAKKKGKEAELYKEALKNSSEEDKQKLEDIQREEKRIKAAR